MIKSQKIIDHEYLKKSLYYSELNEIDYNEWLIQ